MPTFAKWGRGKTSWRNVVRAIRTGSTNRVEKNQMKKKGGGTKALERGMKDLVKTCHREGKRAKK